MTNILNYLTWRGDLPFSSRHPFNSVDDLILARFSYLPFRKIKLARRETIATVAQKMCSLPASDFCLPNDQALIKCLADSARFRNLKVFGFTDHHDSSTERQFTAIAIRLSIRQIYASFMGTDSTITGWKEDLNFSFMENTPAQLDGVKYIHRLAWRYPLSNLRLGGHSKGGNLAIYAALENPQSIQRRILSVSNYDGPGFNEKIIQGRHDWRMLKRITSFITQGSVFGRLLHHPERQVVVHSNGKGIWQHDIYTWEVDGDHFVSAQSTRRSNIIDAATTKWISRASISERRLMTDCIYRLVSSASPDQTIDITSSAATWLKKAPAMVATFAKLPASERKVFNDLLKRFAKAYYETLKSSYTNSSLKLQNHQNHKNH